MENPTLNKAQLLSLLPLSISENSVFEANKNGNSYLGTRNEDNSKRNGKSQSIEIDGSKICVGKDYQANCPEIIDEADRELEKLNEHALIVWSPNHNISDEKLLEYTQGAREKFGYNTEQSLAMLWWHKYDMDGAFNDMGKYSPFPDEWTREDKVIFQEALLSHGKNFHRIRELLPDKAIGELINYYYSSRKKGRRLRFLDRQAKKH